MKQYRKIICIDFDGVIHSYKSGWKGARNIPDAPVDGAIEWLENFLFKYSDIPDSICAMAPPGKCVISIFSSRSRYFGGIRAMKNWLVKHGLDKHWLEVIKFPLWKPASHVLLDDRVILFTGKFPYYDDLVNFKPYWKV